MGHLVAVERDLQHSDPVPPACERRRDRDRDSVDMQDAGEREAPSSAPTIVTGVRISVVMIGARPTLATPPAGTANMSRACDNGHPGSKAGPDRHRDSSQSRPDPASGLSTSPRLQAVGQAYARPRDPRYWPDLVPILSRSRAVSRQTLEFGLVGPPTWPHVPHHQYFSSPRGEQRLFDTHTISANNASGTVPIRRASSRLRPRPKAEPSRRKPWPGNWKARCAR